MLICPNCGEETSFYAHYDSCDASCMAMILEKDRGVDFELLDEKIYFRRNTSWKCSECNEAIKDKDLIKKFDKQTNLTGPEIFDN